MAETTIVKKFGTGPVFLTSVCTILGAILFLRFGWAVGNVGLMATLLIVLIGHLVTLPTSLAIAEIATNQRVEGGGAYYIISRSFGLNIGGSIGIALYLSQAISVAFYVIAFAQSTGPVFEWIEMTFDTGPIEHFSYRLVSIPTMILLSLLVLLRGANTGMNLLYVVAAILGVSLLMFFLGTPETDYNIGWEDALYNFFDPSQYNTEQLQALGFAERPPKEEFFYVFTIIFPAFTGIIAGLGLSGELEDPSKSIPLGTLAATIVGMLVYVAVAFKLSLSLPVEVLANKDRLVMSEIAIWAPIIPIGLAAAAISSALGSILVAPRTLQALGQDDVMPAQSGNKWLAALRPKDGEPINSSIITVAIAFVFVFLGDVDIVAEIIAMFFMVTYGAICLISFLEYFSANPAYRPSFNSRWYFSLPGAILCIYLMFKMNLPYAIMSLVLMVGIYFLLSRYDKNRGGMVFLFKGVIFQISRRLRVTLQKAAIEQQEEDYWVPSIVCISQDSFQRLASFDMVRFISHRSGFGTYIHLVKDFFNQDTVAQSKTILKRLLQRTKVSKSNVYIDTLISPSYTTAVAQVLQLPGISGQDNNMILFEFSRSKPDQLGEVIGNHSLIKAADFDVCVLATSEKGFGYKRDLHIWLGKEDYANGNLMILLAYIILGHPEWQGAEIKIFAVHLESELAEQKAKLLTLIADGRLAISKNNVEFIPLTGKKSVKAIINETSVDADLTIIGFSDKDIKKENYQEAFAGYDELGNTLFINTSSEKAIA
ncbi:MAG: amino acid permease [Bacteroidia bacterium]